MNWLGASARLPANGFPLDRAAAPNPPWAGPKPHKSAQAARLLAQPQPKGETGVPRGMAGCARRNFLARLEPTHHR